MVAGKAKSRVVTDRLDWVGRMVDDIRSLPLESLNTFLADKRNVWTAESCLRRAIEALLDLARHLLAKVHAVGVAEYKQVAEETGVRGILLPDEVRWLKIPAGYRNRLVHLCHAVTPEELFQICTGELEEIVALREAFARWARENPQSIDQRL